MEQVGTLIDHPHRLQHMLTEMLDNAVTLGAAYGLRALGALVIMIVGWFAAIHVQRALLRIGQKSPRVDLTVATFVSGLAKYLIIAFTVVAMLGSFGVETTSVVAVLGAAGIAIGLALQGTLGHVAAGFMLVLFRPFRVGDAVETAGVSGTVTGVSLFSTEIRSDNNIRVIIPNNAVWSGVTKNFTSYSTRRTDLDIPIPFDADFTAALKTVTEVIQADKRILQSPAAVIGVTKFSDTTARLTVQVWTATAQAGTVQIEVTTAIWDRLSRAAHFRRTAPPADPPSRG